MLPHSSARSVGIPSTQQLGRATSSLFFRTLPDRPKRALFVSPERMRTIWHLRAAVFKQKNTNHTRFSDNRKIGPHFPIIGK